MAFRSLSRRLRRTPELPANGAPRSFYEEAYFAGQGDADGRSGYEAYNRTTSNANTAAYLLWRLLPFHRSLDVGCAKGFLVEALCELGFEASGCDISRFATSGASPWVGPRLRVVDLESPASRSKLRRQRFDLITLLEVLEHLRPEAVPDVLSFVRSIADGYVVATIPSFGPNRNGPPGFPDGKVREERLEWYLALGDGFDGPIPFDDLKRDVEGHPVEGHLTMASFEWWTRQFAEAGFVRIDEIEQAAHPVLGRFDLSMSWNLYVFHVDNGPPVASPERSEVELAAIERRWALDQIPLQSRSVDYNRNHVSEAAAAAIECEYAMARERQERFASLR